MALELESVIMREIGLGQHYTWHNGSGGCGYTAQSAVSKLDDAIKKHYRAGERIVAPNHALCALAREAANHDDQESSGYALTTTWQACSDIIAAHIHAAEKREGKERDQYFSAIEQDMRRIYKLWPDPRTVWVPYRAEPLDDWSPYDKEGMGGKW